MLVAIKKIVSATFGFGIEWNANGELRIRRHFDGSYLVACLVEIVV